MLIIFMCTYIFMELYFSQEDHVNVGTGAIGDFHFLEVLTMCLQVYSVCEFACVLCVCVCVFSSHCLGGKNCKEIRFNQEESGMESNYSDAAAKLVAPLAPSHRINTPLAKTKWNHGQVNFIPMFSRTMGLRCGERSAMSPA